MSEQIASDADQSGDASALAGVGALLCASRQRVGEELRDVADMLRIRYPYLEAIEEGRYGDLPGQTYAVGFVRAYAEHLGLDSEEVVRRFKAEIETGGKRHDLHFPTPMAETGIPGGAIVFVGLIVAVLAYGGWYLSTTKDGFLSDLVSPLPERLAALVSDDDQPGNEKPVDDEVAAQPQSSSDTEAPEPPASPQSEPMPMSETMTQPEATPSSAEPAMPETPETAAPAETASAPQTPETPETPATSETSQPASVSEPASAAAQPAPDPAPEPVSEPVSESVSEPAAVAPPAAQLGAAAEPPAAPAAEATPAPAPAPASSSAPVATAEPLAETSTPAAPAVTTEPLEPISTPPAAEAGEAAPQTETTPEPAPPAQTVAASGGSRISVRAIANSWIEVRDDFSNTLLVSRLLREGETYAVPDQSGLSLHTGNAGALVITVDGDAVPAIGAEGAVQRGVQLDPNLLKAGTAAR